MQRLKNLLLIDDDPVHQQIARLILEKQQVAEHIESFLDAQQALDHLKEYAKDPLSLPEVILLDLNMPDMDGWEFLDEYQKIKDQLSALPRIYIFTSSINHSDKKRASGYDIVKGYLLKPLNQQIINELTGKGI